MGKAVARPYRPKAQRLQDAINACNRSLDGVPLYEIAADAGVSLRTVQRWIAWAMTLRLDATVDEYRAQAVARINNERRALIGALARVPQDSRMLYDPETGDRVEVVRDLGTVARLVDALDRIENTEAKLRGAFAPTRVDVTVEQRDAWAGLEALLAEQAEQAERASS